MAWEQFYSFGVSSVKGVSTVTFRRAKNEAPRLFINALYPISHRTLVDLLENRLQHARSSDVPLIDYKNFPERPWWQEGQLFLSLFIMLMGTLLLGVFIPMLVFPSAQLTFQNDSQHPIEKIVFYATKSRKIIQYPLTALYPFQSRTEVLKGFLHGPNVVYYVQQGKRFCHIIDKENCSWEGDQLVFSEGGRLTLYSIDEKGRCRSGQSIVQSCPSPVVFLSN